MADDEITYPKIRAVRDETGASHEECRQALEETGGDVARAAALWFARKVPGHFARLRGRSDPQSGRS
jgi:translation elongation factor EF-Ts